MCNSGDFYIPGKGHWAPKKQMLKADYGAIGGSAIAAAIATSTDDPLIVATAAVVGLVVGHGVGTTLDKIDELNTKIANLESELGIIESKTDTQLWEEDIDCLLYTSDAADE